jgi:1-acyl-sn-glycerol-3-phosphate acyltransferase
VIFPEGHESLDGRLQPLQGGPVLLALKTGVPIVPVAIQGTSAIMPPRSFGIRRARRPVRLVFGRPIAPETLAGGLVKRSAVDHGVNLLTAELLALLGQHGHDPQEPPREQSEGMASDTGIS